MRDPFEEPLEDETLLEEIDLLVGLMLAAEQSEKALSDEDLDRALGLD